MQRRELIQLAIAAGSSLAAIDPARADGEGDGGEQAGALVVKNGTRPFFTYHREPVPSPVPAKPLFTRGAYLHPLHAPCGAVVTDDFPPDHLHQRGVFFAWTKTALDRADGPVHPDFWNLGEGTGRIRSVRVGPRPAGKGLRSYLAEHVWEARSGDAWEAVLDESWTLDIPAALQAAEPDAAGAVFVVDLTSRQRPRVTINLPIYRYGGMCVRGARGWIKSGMTVLTSEGKDWPHADATRARWVDQSGDVDGKRVGVALLEHPGNPAAPNLLRVPPDLPYAVFCPSKGAPMTLQAGREYLFRYRIVTHNGPAEAVALERLWREFTAG